MKAREVKVATGSGVATGSVQNEAVTKGHVVLKFKKPNKKNRDWEVEMEEEGEAT